MSDPPMPFVLCACILSLRLCDHNGLVHADAERRCKSATVFRAEKATQIQIIAPFRTFFCRRRCRCCVLGNAATSVEQQGRTKDLASCLILS